MATRPFEQRLITVTTISGETINILAYLLPGFVAAAVFYSLTPLPRPDAFGQIIHALIFTILGHAVTQTIILPNSQNNTEAPAGLFLVLPVPVAVILAVVVALTLNNDLVHALLRRAKVTRETSYPSEWFSTFARHTEQYVVLHLRGGRRLYCWPEEWPSDPKQGHFRVAKCEWLTDNQSIRVDEVEVMLIAVTEVEMVEFLPKSDKARS